LEGLSHVLLGLAQDVLEDYLALRIGSLQAVSAGFEGVGHFTPLSVQVLPIESVKGAEPLRRSPYIESNHLTSVAVREYLYITLYEILLDALAAEHGMRLMAAESALEWLDDTATTTSRRLANARSEAATQELLDIISGGRKRLRVESI
jgi:F0F1-type ATP synthase gamma subunit